eukprot:674692-Rhodomonas_salina.1
MEFGRATEVFAQFLVDQDDLHLTGSIGSQSGLFWALPQGCGRPPTGCDTPLKELGSGQTPAQEKEQPSARG